MTVTCDIASGASVAASSFSTTGLSAFDLNGALVTGLTADLTVELIQ